MDLTHLRYFQAIASSGSMTAAAKALRVSQPTLTVAMQNLEERLGTTLLLRDRSGVRLTATGHELLRYAGEVFALVERAEAHIKGLEQDDVGSFVIGCHESLGAYFLPQFMAAFLRQFPRIELTLWNGTSAAVAQAVVDRDVHFGIVVNPHPHPDLVLVEMFHDAVDLFVAVDAPPPSRIVPISEHLAAQEIPDEPELADAKQRLRAGPLVYAGRIFQARDILEQLANLDIYPERQLSCGDLELVKSLCLAGIGVGVLPRRVAAYGHEGRLQRLHPALPHFDDTITLVYRADMHKTKAATRVKDALVAYGLRLDGTSPAAR